MRSTIVIEIDNCNLCPHFVKALAWDMPMCGINRFYIPAVSTGKGLDIPSWCPVLLEGTHSSYILDTNGNRSLKRSSQYQYRYTDSPKYAETKHLDELPKQEESPKQNEEARNIELD